MISNSKFKIQNLKLLVVILVIIAVVALIWSWNKAQRTPASPSSQPEEQKANESRGESPKIISTKPDPLEEAIISATEVIEVTFNRPLENEGELKLRFDPKIEFEIKLSQDRKTARIIPKKPYQLGTGYTLFILPDTKFQGVGEWRQEKIFHFKTIRYRGI